MVKLSLFTVALVVVQMCGAYDRVDDCSIEVNDAILKKDSMLSSFSKVRLEDSEYMYVAGKPFLKDSVYALCSNGTVTCHNDNGIADQKTSDTTITSCDPRAVHMRHRMLLATGVADTTDGTWPKNTLCYQIRPNTFSNREVAFLQGAREEYAKNTNVRMITTEECENRADRQDICGNCANYVDIMKDEGCYSLLGYQGRPAQPLSLVNYCFDNQIGTATHEVGHALGLFHEHTHPGRNVIILRRGISVPPSNYEITDDQVIRVSDYDPLSIMHYPLGDSICVAKEAFKDVEFCDIDQTSARGCTIPEERHCNRDITSLANGIGQRQKLSPGDITTINAMYTTATAA